MQKTVNAIESAIHKSLPQCLIEHWEQSLEMSIQGDNFEIYAPSEIVERNTTFECAEYCPDFIAFANDSGSKIAFLRAGHESKTVFLNYASNMRSDSMQDTGLNLFEWIEHGCPFEIDKPSRDRVSAVKTVCINLISEGDLKTLMKIRNELKLSLGVSELRSLPVPSKLLTMSYINAIAFVKLIDRPDLIEITDPVSGNKLPTDVVFS
jgi:hypothetical protein